MPTHIGPIVAARDTLTVIDCVACGWAHLDPLPTAAELDTYYSGTFWERDKSQWLARYEAQRDWIDATNGDYLSMLAGHTDGTTLLDVGCGYGFFVKLANAMDWYAMGMDTSKSAIEYAIEQSPVSIFLQSSWDNPAVGEFSAISAMWLMEHLPNPLYFLKWCRAHLRENGALLLAVPNEWTVVQAEANMKVKVPGYFVHGTHLNYWSAATFGNLLGRAGFRIVDRLGTFQMEKYLVAGIDYTADEAVGAECHADIRRLDLRFNRGQRLVVARDRGRLGIGRDQIVIAKVSND